MEFNQDFFESYLREAPLALAIERTLECNILSKKQFKRPILDIGCGEGLFAKKLFKEKIDLGIDPNPKELKRAEFHNIYNELLLCKGDDIPRKDGIFNTILSNSVMEHIPEIDSVLKEAYRLLSADGILYLTLPTSRFDKYNITYQFLKKIKLYKLSNHFRRFFNKFWAHYHYYDTSDWIEKFESIGFKVNEVQEYASKSTCIFNSFSSPFSIVPYITKKITNCWFVFEAIRNNNAKMLKYFFESFTNGQLVERGHGGLVFFALTKQL